MRTVLIVLVISIVVGAGGSLLWPQQAVPATPLPPGYVPVTEVFDGDTIEVRLPEGKRKVRMLGVDTPETVHPSKPVQCFGPEASHFTKTRLGPTVRLEADPTRKTDKYGRLLRYVYTANGTLFNQSLIEQGFAKEHTYQGQMYAHQAEFKQAEADAKAAGQGLWSTSTCHGDIQQAAA